MVNELSNFNVNIAGHTWQIRWVPRCVLMDLAAALDWDKYVCRISREGSLRDCTYRLAAVVSEIAMGFPADREKAQAIHGK